MANDPKHRPQIIDLPSTTVRKEWCRRPQEAYLADGKRIRRMSVAEIAAIQGFSEDWVNVDGITTNERIAVLGNAVPPPISSLLARIISENFSFKNKTLIEICAGIGGLSSGFSFLTPIAKIEVWKVAATILKHNEPWAPECVIEGKAQDFNYSKYKNQVGLLCGGPPCQPWSLSGKQKGAEDPRDVMGFTPTAIAECEPEMFLFENVPGLLLVREHTSYVEDLFKRMSNPKEGLRYGLATIIINAADYGIPQLRKRVFILGIKGKSNIFVKKILNKLIKMETHHDPNKPSIGKLPWVTLREAFANIPVTEPWRQWNATPETLSRLGIKE
ncbi:MAG: DNA (cytosine-5-)-methyltransferase [Muribaculaceae bacterium]|nr:DNA (cytosine-5-)-methyltransferase [Muribaculaceae bacterium]